MSTKKSMLIIWAVASLLWAVFASYMFDLGRLDNAYRLQDRYWKKLVETSRSQNYRKEYYRRAYERATAQVNEANRDLGLFFLLGIGLPGIMLAIGTAALAHADRPKKTAAQSRKA